MINSINSSFTYQNNLFDNKNVNNENKTQENKNIETAEKANINKITNQNVQKTELSKVEQFKQDIQNNTYKVDMDKMVSGLLDVLV